MRQIAIGERAGKTNAVTSIARSWLWKRAKAHMITWYARRAYCQLCGLRVPHYDIQEPFASLPHVVTGLHYAHDPRSRPPLTCLYWNKQRQDAR